jgi:hypothetical protein
MTEGWKSAGIATEVTENSLSLAEGQTYYFSVKAKNGAGLSSDVGESDGITVDISPPETSVTLDGTLGEDDWWTSDVRVTLSATDNLSGVRETEYRINDGTPRTYSEPFTVTGSVVYYWSVDKAGNSENLNSQEIRIDKTPPSTPQDVTDDGVYTASTEQLCASWTASGDAESSVTGYWYAIGTAPDAADVVDWTSTGTDIEAIATPPGGLTDGQTYYFNVKAENGAGLLSDVGVSDGVTVDVTPPTRPEVMDDGDSTACSFRLHASWTSRDDESGIVEYQYAIGEIPGGNSILGWTSVGTDTDVTATGFRLTNGQIYYFSVKARNNAGAWSDVGVSDGIVVAVTEVELDLYEGWNLISIYVNTGDVGLSSILESQIAGLYTAVWIYDNAEGWKRHIRGGIIEFDTMEAGKGYWINMVDNAPLTISGELVADPTIQLDTGWNLVGHNYSYPLTLDQVTFSIDYTSIWTYDSDTKTWLRHIAGAPDSLNTLTELQPKKGYWICVE